MRAWRIDALDAKAGFAFASHREPWDDAFLLREETTVLFQPPDFVAQRISSPSIAHAAERATFQLGLYESPEVEVAFPQLDAVREFVRCAYLRASGDDVPPAGEAPPPLRPERPGGGELDLEPLEGSDLDAVTTLQAFGSSYGEASDRMGDVALRFDRLKIAGFQAPTIQPTRGAVRLCRAGLRLLWELKRRAPLDSPSKAEWAGWTHSAATLARGFDRLQLWPLLARHFGTSLQAIAAELVGTVLGPPSADRSWPQPYGIELFLLRHHMLTGWVNGALSADLRMFAGGLLPWGFINNHPVAPAGHASASQPFESLALIPIPSSVADQTTARSLSLASLRHLLLALTASPQLMGRRDSAGTDVGAELLLFAACFLTSFPEPRRQASYPQEILLSESLTGAAAYAELESARSIAIALDWLSRNLPAWVFAKQYSAMIEGALKVPVAEPAGMR